MLEVSLNKGLFIIQLERLKQNNFVLKEKPDYRLLGNLLLEWANENESLTSEEYTNYLNDKIIYQSVLETEKICNFCSKMISNLTVNHSVHTSPGRYRLDYELKEKEREFDELINQSTTKIQQELNRSRDIGDISDDLDEEVSILKITNMYTICKKKENGNNTQNKTGINRNRNADCVNLIKIQKAGEDITDPFQLSIAGDGVQKVP